MKTLLICALFIGFSSQEQTCNVQGQCLDAKLLKIVTTTSSLNCLKECKTYEECNFFTYSRFIDGSNCQLLESCNNFGNDNYYLSGSRNCPSEFCEVKGACQVKLISISLKQNSRCIIDFNSRVPFSVRNYLMDYLIAIQNAQICQIADFTHTWSLIVCYLVTALHSMKKQLTSCLMRLDVLFIDPLVQ